MPHPELEMCWGRIAELKQTLRVISARDPQSEACGPEAPEGCEYGCIGCIARATLKRLSGTWKCGLTNQQHWSSDTDSNHN
jgi:hypothetical protein